ncbi:MAG: hypothetical protein D6702_02415 [Planctomycetota bacterium]|nr:MAG: hypothetical protein D6702_02415 [Planctomycetota bacterium]
MRLHSLLLLPPILLLGVAPAPAQSGGRLLQRHRGAQAGDECGRGLAVVGDVDGDGAADYALGIPRADPYARTDAGVVEIRSGADGRLLRSLIGQAAGDWLGSALAAPGDLDRDGVPDLVAGAGNASGHAGSVLAWSGDDGRLLWRVDGAASLDRLGDALAPVPDLDGDGVTEILAGAPGADPNGVLNAGTAWLLSGATGAVLTVFAGSGANDKFGSALAAVGDFDGDGAADLAVGAPYADRGLANTGRVEVFSGAGGALLAAFDGPSEEARFGYAIAGLDDLDGDGVPELLVGAPNAGLAPGAAWVLSGRTGAPLYQHFEGRSHAFGQRVAACGDLDGDGLADYLVGIPYWDDKEKQLASCGRVILFSAGDGRKLWELTGAGSGDTLGDALAAGDLDGDGRAELLLGAPFADPGGRTHGGRVDCWRFDHEPILRPSAGAVSLAAGGTIEFELQFPLGEAGCSYALLASRAGPGPNFFRGAYLPLTPDPLFWKMEDGRYPTAFQDPRGTLDLLARAEAKLAVPPGSTLKRPGPLWLTAVSFRPNGGGAGFVARAVRIDLLP